MISRKQWAVLLFVYILYLLLGALVFLYAERGHEIKNLKELHKQQRRLTLVSNLIVDEDVRREVQRSIQSLERELGSSLFLPNSFQNLITNHVKAIGKELKSHSNNENISLENNSTDLQQILQAETNEDHDSNETLLKRFWDDITLSDKLVEDEMMWTLWNAFFFAFTAITTIGFGHMSPKTHLGQVFCLVYSIFGVPFNGILFAGLADLFANKFIKKIDGKRYEHQGMIFVDAVLYLIPGIFIFFVIPAAIFMVVEGWSYISSFYFAFITLSTIGFGDMVSGYVELSSGWLWVYRMFIQAWIIFGLGYLFMIITFIQRALRSKQLRIIDRKMAKLLKHKKMKSTANVQKDLEKLGAVLKTISTLRVRNVVYNIKNESKDSSLTALSGRNLSSGKTNRAYEESEGEWRVGESMEQDLPSEAPNTKETDSVDIFLQLAKSVLEEIEANSEASSDTDDKSRKTDLNATKRKNSVPNNSPPANYFNKDMKSENVLKPDSKEGQDVESSKRRSFKRTLTSFLPPGINKVMDSNASSSANDASHKPDKDEDTDEDNKIENLGDLIEKVERVLSQEMADTKETINLPFARNRSYSLFSDTNNHSTIQSNHSLPAGANILPSNYIGQRKGSYHARF